MTDEHGFDAPEGPAPQTSYATPAVPSGPRQRKYLPTLADLVDRLTIAQLKEIFITDHREEYRAEIALIQHDIDILLEERTAVGRPITASDVRAIAVIMLANRAIWESEAKARAGGSEQDRLLKFTHSINGLRNTAKNLIAKSSGERLDWKVDCFAAELIKDFGNWQVFDLNGNDGR